MPISVDEFNEKGTVPQRTGFSGTKTKDIMALLGSEEAAFSITEVAEAVEVDAGDVKAIRNLKNLMYSLRKKGKVEVKMIDKDTYYALVSAE